MKFRTEIGKITHGFHISHDSRIVMLGSCFADNIGERLSVHGFDVVHNPLGPLFNPASIARVLARRGRPYTDADMVCGPDGVWHCLDFASRYRGSTAEEVVAKVNADWLPLGEAIDRADTIIITFGTNKVFCHDNVAVGNCHKLPAGWFDIQFLDVEDVCRLWRDVLPAGRQVIFTVSPVRYPGDGLPQSCLSKAVLRVAVDRLCHEPGADYFPAYEIVTDDLRDYRFYGTDMRHPSEAAVEYIFDHFADTYFTPSTLARAREYYKEYLRASHRNIL